MHLEKEEMEILIEVIWKDLEQEVEELQASYTYLSKVPKEEKRKLEIKRNLFRRLKKELKITLREEDAILVGLTEEISPETLQKWVKKADEYRETTADSYPLKQLMWWRLPIFLRAAAFFFDKEVFKEFE
jgi:predicted secreted Zn-dependent protease